MVLRGVRLIQNAVEVKALLGKDVSGGCFNGRNAIPGDRASG
jgi:hypothetical protein